MKLYYAVVSPFARKVRMAAIILGLDQEIQLEKVDVFSDAHYKSINPLMKIPALETRDGLLMCDSPVIVEYLDSLSSTKKVIPADKSRWQALHFQAIADGIMDASVLRRLESLRPIDKQDAKADQRQKDKIANGLEYFETNIQRLRAPWTIAEITLMCAFGYLELRFESENWLGNYPGLRKWREAAQSIDFVRMTDYK